MQGDQKYNHSGCPAHDNRDVFFFRLYYSFRV